MNNLKNKSVVIYIKMIAKKNEWSLKTAIDNCEYTNLELKPVSPRYSESVFTFKNDTLLSGQIHTFITQEMEISRMDITSAKNILIEQDDNIERSVSTFINKGCIFSEIKDVNQTFNQQSGQHSFINANIEQAKHTIQAGETSLLYINFKPGMINNILPEWHQYTKDLYYRDANKKYFATPPANIVKNNNLQQLLMVTMAKTFNNVTRYLYIEAKTMELLSRQFDEIIMNSKKEHINNFISKADKEKLVAVYEYINIHYLEPLSLLSLTRKFMLNEFKLKKGFKYLYEQSVFNYILSLRMQKAKALLLESDMNVTEVSDIAGYSSVHNFSNAFYKMYNYRPGKLKMHLQEEVG